MFVNRFAGQLDTEAFEGLDINLRQHHTCVYLTAFQVRDLFHCFLSSRVQSSTAGERDQDLIGVQSRVAASQISSFQNLDRFDGSSENRPATSSGLPGCR